MTLAKSLQAAAGNAAAEGVYIEDVFSTYLYTGNGSTQTINNGIDLAGEGGLVWAKKRNSATDGNHILFDTARGQPWLSTNNTSAQLGSSGLINYNSDGFGWTFGSASWNSSGDTFASWTFRKQPKFFDVVTWTGNSTARTIAHNLGSVPGCIMVKAYGNMASIGNASDWLVYHRSTGNTNVTFLNTTTGSTDYGSAAWNSTTPTSTVFSLGTDSNVNQNSVQYVAYLFAHDAGGFGESGEENVVSCGSYTGTGVAGLAVTLGYDPQWILWKNASQLSDWNLFDNMRGMTVSGDQVRLRPNLSNAEGTYAQFPFPTATGFIVNEASAPVNGSGDTMIYIAIRRGPMKVPTDGTEVFKPNTYTGTGAVLPITGMGFPPDFLLTKDRQFGNDWCAQDKLRGPSQYLRPNGTGAELNLGTAQLVSIDQTGVTYGSGSSSTNFNGSPYINLSFRRAPGFFDEVCYTGDGIAGRAITHNLGVTPEWMIVKRRSNNDGAGYWASYSAATGNTQSTQFGTVAAALTNSTFWNNTSPTSTNFTVGTITRVNGSAETYVAYLFASCPGVSKCGSYTGNGSSQTIPCGFAAGARFVLIKRTDSTGDWYVWDSARGIVAGNDPHLSLNTTAAEVTTDDSVDPASTGFIVNQLAATNINVTSASYIFLAIA